MSDAWRTVSAYATHPTNSYKYLVINWWTIQLALGRCIQQIVIFVRSTQKLLANYSRCWAAITHSSNSEYNNIVYFDLVGSDSWYILILCLWCSFEEKKRSRQTSGTKFQNRTHTFRVRKRSDNHNIQLELQLCCPIFEAHKYDSRGCFRTFTQIESCFRWQSNRSQCERLWPSSHWCYSSAATAGDGHTVCTVSTKFERFEFFAIVFVWSGISKLYAGWKVLVTNE